MLCIIAPEYASEDAERRQRSTAESTADDAEDREDETEDEDLVARPA